MDLTEVRFEELDANSTTLIMRGLNRQTTREMFLAMLDATCQRKGMYNYIYVPWTTDGASNIGLAFANFESPAACQEYVFGFSNPENLAKIARYHVRSIGPAAIQGRGANLTAMLGKRGHEALRGFDSPLVFNQGVKASLAEVADQEVPGGLAQALAKAKAVSTHALASPHRSRRHASSVQAVGADDANEAAFGGASSSTVYSGAIVAHAGYSPWRVQEPPLQVAGQVAPYGSSYGASASYISEPAQLPEQQDAPRIRVQVLPQDDGAPATTKIIFDL